MTRPQWDRSDKGDRIVYRWTLGPPRKDSSGHRWTPQAMLTVSHAPALGILRARLIRIDRRIDHDREVDRLDGDMSFFDMVRDIRLFSHRALEAFASEAAAQCQQDQTPAVRAIFGEEPTNG